MIDGRRLLAVALLAGMATACVASRPPVVSGTPRYPDYPTPIVPEGLTASATVLARHETAWQRLQGGDLRGARSDYDDVLDRSAGFYPARAGLGFVALAGEDADTALGRFDEALAADAAYLPALIGRVDALLELGRDADAVPAMERILEIDPGADRVRGRLELIRFRAVQRLIAGGQQARAAGRLDAARAQLEQALGLSPSSPIILRELTQVERDAGRLDVAERYARQALDLDPRDVDGLTALGAVLEARGQFAAAADAYDRAVAIDPRPEWRDHAVDLRERAQLAALPGDFAHLPSAATVTRGQVAALIGIRLGDLVARAPVRVTEIATDIRTHWAAGWILALTRAGVITIFPNHTFQPDAVVSRGELAAIAAGLVELAMADRPGMLETWRTAQPRFVDLPPANVRYEAVALAVTSGAMSAGPGGEFRLADPASGADLDVAVDRIHDLTR